MFMDQTSKPHSIFTQNELNNQMFTDQTSKPHSIFTQNELNNQMLMDQTTPSFFLTKRPQQSNVHG